MIAHLRLEIARLRREQYGQGSERRTRLLEQLELQLEELETAAAEDGIAAEPMAPVMAAVVAEHRRPARKPFPEHLPRERVVVEGPVNCSCCGSARLVKMGEDITETLEVVPRRWKVIQTVREKFSCRDCERISQPPAPFHATPRGWAGPNLLAMVLFEKFGQHQPLNRQADRYAREGVEISLSTLADQVGACTAALRPIHALIRAHVMAAERLHGDDTTVPLLARGGAKTARLWTYVRDDRPFAGGAPPAALFPERFFHEVPRGAKKADLMFLQHMLHVTRDGGMIATVMPHGVLFRGGDEGKIRQKIIEQDQIEAIIGLGPQLFYGTGIPACVIVLRQRVHNGANLVSGKPKDRQGKILFINADREYFEGRAQNHLMPEHIEKIVTTFEEYREIPGFSAIVDIDTLRDNDFNLNIRRYADNAPPPEPHDVRAHLVGGIPRAEVAAKADLFRAHGLDPMDLLVPRDDRYLDFAPHLTAKSDLKPAIEANAGLQAREVEIRAAFNAWWAAHQNGIVALAGADQAAALIKLRDELLSSFSETLEGLAMLDPFTVRGIIAQFWQASRFDFLTLMARDGRGVVDAWRTSIVTALEDKGHKESPLDHKLVSFLMGGFVREIAELEARKAELDAQIKAATATPEEGEEEDDDTEPVDEAQVKRWKKELTEVKKTLKAKHAQFTDAINGAVDGLTEADAAALILKILHHDMEKILTRYIAAQRGQIVAAFENWWDKYRVTLTEIEGARAEATGKLAGFLKGLGYV